MGIERFFSSIQTNDITNLQTSFTKTLEKRLDAGYFYIDFNSIIYIVSGKIMADLNILLYNLIKGKSDNKKINKIIEEYDFKEDITFNKLKELSNSKKLDQLIIQKVLEYVKAMLNNYIDPNKLKLLYIAIDGVPLKSKIMEQRKRRYMGSVIDKMKEQIFIKHKKSLEKDSDRYLFETSRVRWNRIKITPGTEFMDMLVNNLTSDSFVNYVKNLCPKFKSYVFSGPYEPGEGEKKIVDHLRGSDHKEDEYVVYSPDSDVSLLCLLLNSNLSPKDKRKITKLNILRHNMQKGNYDVIDIDTLSNNLYSYVIDELGTESNKISKDNVINDIVFLLTIFGNDFVPKLQSFNVKYDFDRIINKYIEVLEANKYNHLISFNNKTNKKQINPKIFFEIIKILKRDEGGNLQKMYMTSHYKNYDRLKRIMEVDHENFTQKINDFLADLRAFNNEIRKLKENDVETFKKKWLVKKNEFFLNKMKRLTRLGLENPKEATIDEFVDAYLTYYFSQNKLPKVGIYFQRYKNSLESEFHKQRLESSLDYLDPKLKVTSYDEEIYKLDNMLDEYQKKLSAYSLDLGYVNIDTRGYVWKTAKVVDSVKKYYKEFFNIDNIDSKNKKMKRLVQEYVNGLVWVFNFYFNNFDEDENRKYGDAWFYPYEYAPLLTQIYYHLRDQNINRQYFDKIQNKLNDFRVNRKEYFNCLEHFMYVSPAPYVLSVIPKEYNSFAKQSKFYPDLDKIVDEIISNPMTSDEINCKGIIFLNKCNLKNIHLERDFNNDRKFIKELRNIKVSPEVEIRKGTYKEGKSNINYFNNKVKNKKNKKNKIKKNPNEAKYIRLKRRYLKTGKKDDKKRYKFFKYSLFYE